MNQPLLVAKNIWKKFKAPVELTVLNGVDLTVYGSESVAIMGRSGEGKSTLLQVLGSLESPTEGTITIGDVTMNRWNMTRLRRKKIAYVFQSYYLLEDYTTLENILMPAKIDRQETGPGSPSYKRALELLEKVGLSDKAHLNTKLLSGGEKQRVAIARALCNSPDLIFADEPTGNLDRETAEIIYSLLLDYAHQEGKGMILVTHHDELASLCKRGYILKEGLLHPY